MRGTWPMAMAALMVCACSPNVDRAVTAVMAEPATVSADPDYLATTPVQVRETPTQYVNCVRAKQGAPDYDVLSGKLFFYGAPPKAALASTAKPKPDEKWAIERWEIERKDCVVMLDPFLDYFVHTDTSIARRFQQLQEAIRATHVGLGNGTLTYGAAVTASRAAEGAFWKHAATYYRSMAAVLTPQWLAALPTL